jgi:polar amino acid transport system permease protein
MDILLTNLPLILRGLIVTLEVSLLTLLLGTALGLAGGLSLLYGGPLLRWPARIYVDFVRGVPQLVLIFAIFYGLPTVGLQASALAAGVLALGFFCGAHVSEIVRGAIDSIPRGQSDAAKAIGLTFGQRLRLVLLPQAIGRILPAWVNTAVEVIKASSLVSLVSVIDLMMAVQQIVGRTRETLLFYTVAALLYFVINYGVSAAGRRLERRYAYA